MIDLFDASKNYYAVLGVGQECEVAAIKTAFRKLARQFHPDVNDHPNAKRRFQEVSEAYEVLSRHRQTYDSAVGELRQAAAHSVHTRTHRAHSTAAHHHTRPQSSAAHRNNSFNTGSQHTQARTKHNHYSQSIQGHDRVMVYPVTLKYAFYLLKQGHFFIPSLKTKLVFDSRSMAGDTVSFRGKGFPGMFGGSAGDYIVSFKLTHHTPFHIDKGDLHMQLKVARHIWEKGGEVYFDAPTGLFKVKILRHMNMNTTLRFQHKGLPADRHQQGGHLFAKLVLEG